MIPQKLTHLPARDEVQLFPTWPFQQRLKDSGCCCQLSLRLQLVVARYGEYSHGVGRRCSLNSVGSFASFILFLMASDNSRLKHFFVVISQPFFSPAFSISATRIPSTRHVHILLAYYFCQLVYTCKSFSSTIKSNLSKFGHGLLHLQLLVLFQLYNLAQSCASSEKIFARRLM